MRSSALPRCRRVNVAIRRLPRRGRKRSRLAWTLEGTYLAARAEARWWDHPSVGPGMPLADLRPRLPPIGRVPGAYGDVRQTTCQPGVCPVPALRRVTAPTAGEGGKWNIMCLTLPSEYDTIHSRSWESRPRAGRIEARRPVRSRGEPSLEGLRGSPAARRCPRACRLRQPVAATGASAPGHAAGHRRDPARDHGRLASPGGSGLARDASAAHGSVRRRVAPERSRGRPERRRHRPGTL
jgi:hypothetical protein